MPDARCTRSLVCAIGNKYAHEYSQRATGITRHSRTQWFTAYTVLSPATGFLATVVTRIAPQT
jgi:phage terminase large subunit-like protein